MTRAGRAILGCAAGIGFLLSGCTDLDLPGPGPGTGFQAQYFSARTALESGNYNNAVARYKTMIDGAGPLESRLRLEMAHALLRADRYDEAVREASIVATMHDDNRRAAALAVLGTAEHRMAQERMSEGDFGPETVAHLRRAQAAFAETLSRAPDLDPLGAVAERQAMVSASLSNLGG